MSYAHRLLPGELIAQSTLNCSMPFRLTRALFQRILDGFIYFAICLRRESILPTVAEQSINSGRIFVQATNENSRTLMKSHKFHTLQWAHLIAATI